MVILQLLEVDDHLLHDDEVVEVDEMMFDEI